MAADSSTYVSQLLGRALGGAPSISNEVLQVGVCLLTKCLVGWKELAGISPHKFHPAIESSLPQALN